MIQETTCRRARSRLASRMDQVAGNREAVLIRRRGKEPVALVAAEVLAGWIETAYLVRPPKNARRLVEAEQQIAARAGERWTVERLCQRFALVAE